MPELPEVETVRKGLERLVVNQEIASITIKVPKMVKTDLNDFMISLPGKTIQQVLRRGSIFFLILVKWLWYHIYAWKENIYSSQIKYQITNIFTFISN